MNRRIVTNALAAVLPLTMITGCVTTNNGGPAKVEGLVGWVERVYVETELAKESAHSALETLKTIAASDFDGEAVAAYTQLMTAIKGSEDQARKVRANVVSMQRAARPVFTQWTNDLENFSSPEMRRRSLTRLADTRERYDAIVTTAEPAQTAYDAFNKSLRDHALFLGHDFNPTAVAEIQDGVKRLASTIAELDAQFDACLAAAQGYTRSAALPVGATPQTQPVPGPSK